MEVPEIIINTTMTKDDYRKFLYIAAFRRNKTVIPLILLIAIIGGLVIGFENDRLIMSRFVIGTVFLCVLSVAYISLRIEWKSAKRVKTDKTGTFDTANTLKFYDDRIVMENDSIKSTAELKYDQFYTVLESNDYFIFYFTINQASLIRKKDMDNPDAFRDFIANKFNGKFRQI